MAKFRMQLVDTDTFTVQYKRTFWPFWCHFRVERRVRDPKYQSLSSLKMVPWTGPESSAQKLIENLTKREQVFK